jgi:hypothetical protein
MEGEIEQSPEEMRVRHYLALAQGNPQESVRLIYDERVYTIH